MENNSISSINEKEVMEFYGLKGSFGRLGLRLKILRSWLLHKSSFPSINSSWVSSSTDFVKSPSAEARYFMALFNH